MQTQSIMIAPPEELMHSAEEILADFEYNYPFIKGSWELLDEVLQKLDADPKIVFHKLREARLMTEDGQLDSRLHEYGILICGDMIERDYESNYVGLVENVLVSPVGHWFFERFVRL